MSLLMVFFRVGTALAVQKNFKVGDLMKLYAVVDRKSACAEYMLAQNDSDALRMWFVMLRANQAMYAFLDEFDLVKVGDLAETRTVSADDVSFSGERMKALLDSREEMYKNARSKD